MLCIFIREKKREIEPQYPCCLSFFQKYLNFYPILFSKRFISIVCFWLRDFCKFYMESTTCKILYIFFPSPERC